MSPRGDGKQRPGSASSPTVKSGRSGDGASRNVRPAASTASATREIIESIVIAFVLAFLFRTFEAEAFVIPTGSMAPTLMGRHKDLICEECGFPFQVSASDEIDARTNTRYADHRSVIAATCPNCRHTMYVGPDPRAPSHPSYKGDRILVAKFPYRFEDPERWDVAVFKYPGEARTNFIKRIVGLPGETIRIDHGDLFVKNGDRNGWKIARKSPRKLRAMMRTVYDNDYVPPEILSGEFPRRWTSEGTTEASGWAASEDLKSFRTDGAGSDGAWIGYRHCVPTNEDWQQLNLAPNSPVDVHPQLISDFTGYDTGETRPVYGRDDMNQIPPPTPDKMGVHWVGDLAVETELEISGSSGEVVLELVEGGQRFRCRIDVASGRATLGIDGVDDFQPTATTAVQGPGTYRVFFANFDDKLYLSVDGSNVDFDAPTTFGPLDDDVPTLADLEPVRIGSLGVAMEARHLKVYRDIYYIAVKNEYPGNPMTEYQIGPITSEREVVRMLSDPDVWPSLAANRNSVQFKLDKDQFLVFGDNSAESKDSRLWGSEYYVSRDLLIGKALVIYWPHSLDQIPGTKIPIRFFPNFKRMEFVR